MAEDDSDELIGAGVGADANTFGGNVFGTDRQGMATAGAISGKGEADGIRTRNHGIDHPQLVGDSARKRNQARMIAAAERGCRRRPG